MSREQFDRWVDKIRREWQRSPEFNPFGNCEIEGQGEHNPELYLEAIPPEGWVS